MVPDSIEREVVIQASVQRVWEILTDPAHMPEWFSGATARVDLRPGGALVFHWEEHGTFHGSVERVEPPRAFSFRWALTADEAPAGTNATLVAFTLTPEGAATRLRVVESGFGGLSGTGTSPARHVEDNRHGWAAALAGLQAYAPRQEAFG